MRKPAPSVVALVAVVLVVALGGCGVRAENEPRTLAVEEVPYGLLDDAPASPTTAPPVERVNVAVYFLVGERLQPAPRAVADPATPARALGTLLDGPSDEEAVSGLRTAIHPATEIAVTRPSPDVVAVDLSQAFTQVPSQEQRLALGQLVYTATGIAGVSGVRFTIAGAPVGVPLADGSVTPGPVGREAFPTLAPPPPNAAQ